MIQKVKNYLWHLPKSIFFNLIYGFPSRQLILIGVTGTDGKTTTAHLIYHLLKNANLAVGLISTVEARINNQIIDTGLHTTSPDPALLQKLFFQAKKANLKYMVCEVTSHALDQFRFLGCRFHTSVLTNTSAEHLDYHQSMTNYLHAKTKLFLQSQNSILNKDDPSYVVINSLLTTKPTTYSIKQKSQLQAKNIKITSKHLKFKVGRLQMQTDSNYYYQVYNILAALAVAQKLKINPSILQKTIKNFPQVKGRRQVVPNTLRLRTIIDFAHTPAALKQTLSSLKITTKNQLIVIFGATGGRDPRKRPQMGKFVSQIANIGLITADDTRHESVADINRQIIAGIKPDRGQQFSPNQTQTASQINHLRRLSSKKFVFFNIPRRQDAFNLAVKIAKPGDTIIACGKGHETTILHGSTEYPWSETEAFRAAFKLASHSS